MRARGGWWRQQPVRPASGRGGAPAHPSSLYSFFNRPHVKWSGPSGATARDLDAPSRGISPDRLAARATFRVQVSLLTTFFRFERPKLRYHRERLPRPLRTSAILLPPLEEAYFRRKRQHNSRVLPRGERCMGARAHLTAWHLARAPSSLAGETTRRLQSSHRAGYPPASRRAGRHLLSPRQARELPGSLASGIYRVPCTTQGISLSPCESKARFKPP